MYSGSDLFIAYRPPTTWRGLAVCGTLPPPPPPPQTSPLLMHYFGFASPRRAVATAADIELLR